MSLVAVPELVLSTEIGLAAVSADPEALKLVPEWLLTPKLVAEACATADEEAPSPLRLVPESVRTEAVCLPLCARMAWCSTSCPSPCGRLPSAWPPCRRTAGLFPSFRKPSGRRTCAGMPCDSRSTSSGLCRRNSGTPWPVPCGRSPAQQPGAEVFSPLTALQKMNLRGRSAFSGSGNAGRGAVHDLGGTAFESSFAGLSPVAPYAAGRRGRMKSARSIPP